MTRSAASSGERRPLRALHVVAGLSLDDGGPSYSVPRLCSALDVVGCETQILTVAGTTLLNNSNVEAFEPRYSRLPLAARLRFSPALQRATNVAASYADVVHAHGLWLMPNVYTGKAAAQAGKPLIVSPRGMLAPEALQFSVWRKRIMWAVFQRPAYARAAVWHATSAAEATDLRAFGISAPIAVIPNGVDVPGEAASHAPVKQRRTLLFLSRIHPKKGLPTLVAAWASVASRCPDWDLVIAGPEEGSHRFELGAQAEALGASRISFVGPLYGAEREALVKESDLFILPTQNENFGIVVAEALAAGVPAIVSKGAPWAGLEAERCGWWIDHGFEAIAAALLEATALSASERRSMGERGRAWMKRDFGWDAIARRMASVYLWLREGGSPPDCVGSD